MDDRHRQWIAENVRDRGCGQCAEITLAMLEAFPELTRVCGHYHDWVWGEREHWWLKTNDGQVVDPTAAQFPTRGAAAYVEVDPNAPRPTGMCPNCGE